MDRPESVAAHDGIGGALAFAETTARAAARALFEASDLEVRRKQGTDIVTAADHAAEQVVLTAIRSAYPNDAILAEESGGSLGHSGRRWCVDPLDGTVNFANGIPCFAVVIALERGDHGELGVVFDPSRDELFSVRRGWPSRLNGGVLGAEDRAGELSDAVVALALPTMMMAAPGAIERWAEQCRGVRLTGSTAIELAWAAAGRYDLCVYRRTPARWDWVAGELLIAEAPGCAVRTLGDFEGVEVVAAGSAELVEGLDPAFFIPG